MQYEINVCNSGTAVPDVTYRFRFTTKVRNPETFLYNTGQITSIDSTAWNRPQYYEVARIDRKGNVRKLATGLAVPPVNVGVRSTPDYADTFTAAAVHSLPGGRKVFAGQRAEGFFVDLGSIFDLGALRPFQNLHLIPSAAAMGVNGTQAVNVHTIAIQVPKSDVSSGGKVVTNPAKPGAVIGVYATASRRRVRVVDISGDTSYGEFQQISRLANPLFNEVIVPMSRKDEWNHSLPHDDGSYASLVAHPELATLLPVLYPGVFPHLAAYSSPRADLLAVLLTGIPSGIIPGFQNFTGPTQADLLRLNMAIAPTQDPNQFGILGGDLAGFPNGRRVADDVVAIELRAVAGATIPLVDSTYTPDGAAAVLTDGTSNTNAPYLDTFPYLGTPAGGYQSMPGTPGGTSNAA